MVVKQITNNCSDDFIVYFKDFFTHDRLMSGVIKELESVNNKAYRRIKERQVKDFQINFGTITIWI